MTIRDLSKLLPAISVADLTAYLGTSGWTRKPFSRPDVLLFVGPQADDGEALEIVLPDSEAATDFRDRVRDALTTLSGVEDRDETEVAREVLRPWVDHLSVRLIGKQAEDGALPLNVAAQLIRATEQLVIATAAAEERPVPYYGRATKLAAEHARACRFGQTALGSFVINVECPTLSLGQQSIDMPFPRRVTNRLMRGLKRTHSAVQSGTPGPLALGHVDGLNANVCEALLELHNAAPDLVLGFSVAFSRVLPVHEDLRGEVLLEDRSFEFLAVAARRMRGAATLGERDIEGQIVRLVASDPGEADEEDDVADGERVATLRFMDAGRRQHALMQLEVDAYKEACDAHRDGNMVRVRGTLERFGRRWRLLGIKEFTVLPVATQEPT